MSDTKSVTKPDMQSASDNWRLPTTTHHPALLDSNGSDADFRRMIYGIFTMTVNFDRIRECMATALGLSGIQYHILMVVAELSADLPVTVTTVAGRLHTSGAYVTMETKKLIRRGFLDKQRNPDDGRSVIITLTDEGRAAIDAFAPYHQEINSELFSDIDAETFQQFRAIVDHMSRTSTRAAEKAEILARDHTDIGDKAVGAIWR
ncbi:MAG: MarR family winged helix-turn-helix transcriptional regulator [Alphaproteobacteria bacterium]|nr:MarR family winged helix-turn-helix transcriptional regulator [Alphaproteobacteria bacterium]